MLQFLKKVYGNIRSACNLLLNETKQCYVWTTVSFFESFLTTRLTQRLQLIIKKFAQHLGRASLAFLVLLYPY